EAPAAVARTQPQWLDHRDRIAVDGGDIWRGLPGRRAVKPKTFSAQRKRAPSLAPFRYCMKRCLLLRCRFVSRTYGCFVVRMPVVVVRHLHPAAPDCAVVFFARVLEQANAVSHAREDALVRERLGVID